MVWLAAWALTALPRLARAAPDAAPASAAASGLANTTAPAGQAAVAPPAGTDKAWPAEKQPPDAITGVVYDKVAGASFSLQYPDTWQPDKGAKDFDPNTNFTLVSPKNSYVQITISPKTSDPAKIVSETVKKLDGPAITTLTRTKIEEWGKHEGQGLHLKGKIVGSFPGGIKIFVFSSAHFNILVIEYYFSDELKDVQDDFDSISENFKMTD
jgi:hypothetical protein